MATEYPTECSFCRRTMPGELCISVRKDMDGTIRTGALCQGCVDAFILEMAHTDRERFNRLITEALAQAGQR